MKIIHVADLHLDSKMESNLPIEKARERREELLETYERMVEYADANRVRVILIAGDFFDKKHNRKSVRKRVLEQVRRHPGIDFLYLRGNHDDSDFLIDEKPSNIPSNLKSFREDEWVSYDYGDVVITGREIRCDNARLLANNLVLDQARCNIVTLHGQEMESDGPDRAEIINRSEFRGKNIDYLALGHVHSYKEGRLDDRGVWAYSGCLEGRGFDECGKKGFVLLDVTDGQITSEFIPFARRTLHEVNVDLNEEMSMPDVIEAVNENLRSIPSDDLVKIVLNGKIHMDLDLDLGRIRRTFLDRFYYVKVKDKTSVKIDYESYREDRSLKGEFVRLLEGEDLPEEERALIIETGMRAIMGEDIEE